MDDGVDIVRIENRLNQINLYSILSPFRKSKTSDFFEANIRTFDAKPPYFCPKKSDVLQLPQCSISSLQKKFWKNILHFLHQCPKLPVIIGDFGCRIGCRMRCRIALQGVGTPRSYREIDKITAEKGMISCQKHKETARHWKVFFSWYEAIWLLQGKVMCFHTEYVIEKWCKTCTNPTSYTLSYTLSFTRNSFYLLPISLCGVGNVGEFKKTFFGNGGGQSFGTQNRLNCFFIIA